MTVGTARRGKQARRRARATPRAPELIVRQLEVEEAEEGWAYGPHIGQHGPGELVALQVELQQRREGAGRAPVERQGAGQRVLVCGRAGGGGALGERRRAAW